MKFDLLFSGPPAIVWQLREINFGAQLRAAQERQRQRDLEAEAYIDNAFWGIPYKSLAEEYPWLGDELAKKGIPR
jgi:hypothetical protein